MITIHTFLDRFHKRSTSNKCPYFLPEYLNQQWGGNVLYQLFHNKFSMEDMRPDQGSNSDLWITNSTCSLLRYQSLAHSYWFLTYPQHRLHHRHLHHHHHCHCSPPLLELKFEVSCDNRILSIVIYHFTSACCFGFYSPSRLFHLYRTKKRRMCFFHMQSIGFQPVQIQQRIPSH